MGGEHDVVKAALTKLGTVSFRKVAMQPGMPQGFGLIGATATPIFTLPETPCPRSCRSPVRRARRPCPSRTFQLNGTYAARPGWQARPRHPPASRSFLRGILDRGSGSVTPLTGQNSHQIASLARANALIVIPEPVTEPASRAS